MKILFKYLRVKVIYNMKELFIKTYSRFKKIAYGSLSIILFFLLWEVASDIGLANPVLVSKPTSIFAAIFKLIQSGELFIHLSITLKRASVGFFIAILIAIPAGFIIGGFFKGLEPILAPMLRLLEKINPFALFPLFIFIFGIGEVSKVVLIFWVAQWPILFNTIAGLRDIDPLLIKSARSMGASKTFVFFKVIVPSAIPNIFTGIKVGAQIACFMVISAEMLGASKGLGWLTVTAQANYQIPLLFAASLCIAVLGVAINELFAWLEALVSFGRQTTFENIKN
jgi:NitT/TauT family transport system permease protein